MERVFFLALWPKREAPLQPTSQSEPSPKVSYLGSGKARIFEMLYNLTAYALAVNVDRVSPGLFFSAL